LAHSILRDVVDRLARRTEGRTEADIQSDVRFLLLTAELDLQDQDLVEPPKLETQAGAGRRIDVELGATVIEVKKDLRGPHVRKKAIEQLAVYVHHRSTELEIRYVGILTDGVRWELYHLEPGTTTLKLVSEFELSAGPADVDGLCNWLEGVLATAKAVTPTPDEIKGRLGADSSAHALDFADLSALYAAHRDVPTVRLKRELWARLLTTAFGTNFRDEDALFVEHTLLVVTAELIAHAVVGFDLSDVSLPVSELLAGRRFADAAIGGVVEHDFFDWIAEVQGGDVFVRTHARRLRRFAWDRVEHDVMKVLYESVIAAEQRKKLGEYYTPDWLAEKVVEAVVDRPLEHRVLDPACGSGTFIFHAIRRVLAAAEEKGLTNAQAIQLATTLVTGVDIHPVAVTLARVTYLLALGRDRLTDPDRTAFSVPIYLGDSLQWGQEKTLFDTDDLVVRTAEGGQRFTDELRFPRALLADAGRFDQLVGELAERSTGTAGHSEKALVAVFSRFQVPKDLHARLLETFATLLRLHQAGRDHIWGYYVRNLARPAWLNRSENRVDRLIGNPPWLSYRFMTPAMQAEFQQMTRERGLWSKNASVATHQDLSGLFVARAVQLYLREGGSFGFVMPNAVLSRRQFEGFRAGSYEGRSESELTAVAFAKPWDLEPIRPIFFPQASCVVFGTRAPMSAPSPLSPNAIRWTGKLPGTNPSWVDAAPHIRQATARGPDAQEAGDDNVSPYAPRFSQGATLVPRVLCVVEDAPAGPLGAGRGQRAIQSRRSAAEKPPWKTIKPCVGTVEKRFVRKLLLGETVLHYRLAPPLLTVIPWDGERLLDDDAERLSLYAGLEKWWRKASALWIEHRSSERLTLLQQIDFRSKLTQQFPIPAWRLVYTKSGINLTAAVVDDPNVIIDHTLYWAPLEDELEGRYLEAVLNSDTVLKRLKPLQSRGKDSPRHIDKYVWQLPIPRFDPQARLHLQLADLAAKAAAEAATVHLRPGDFRVQRGQIREHLAAVGLAGKIDAAVEKLLPT
jgi:SAM-dependent methyltransferase